MNDPLAGCRGCMTGLLLSILLGAAILALLGLGPAVAERLLRVTP